MTIEPSVSVERIVLAAVKALAHTYFLAGGKTGLDRLMGLAELCSSHLVESSTGIKRIPIAGHVDCFEGGLRRIVAVLY